MKDAKVWLRIGDSGNYEFFDTPYDAGYELAMYTSAIDIRYRPLGVELGGFTGNNYVSLFWGDKDAQPVGDAELNQSDKLDFEQGYQEGLDN